MAPSEVEVAPNLRARLPRVDLATAKLGNDVLTALNGAASAVGPLYAGIEPGPVGDVALRFSSGLAARPLTIEGAPATWLTAEAGPELPEALVELSRLEPLLAGVERALGLPLEPERLERWASNEGALAMRVVARDESGLESHAIRLFVPAGSTIAPPPRQQSVGRLAGVAAGARVPVQLILEGPTVPAGEIASLIVGDLVLAGAGSEGMRARLVASAKVSAYGRWRPADRDFMCEELMDGSSEREALPAQGGLSAEMTVRLSLELGAVDATLGELAALAPGTVLKVDFADDAPRVEVKAGGAYLATGRLVSLGEAYGVLIDAVRDDPRPGAAAV